jgi:hypothetical protein
MIELSFRQVLIDSRLKRAGVIHPNSICEAYRSPKGVSSAFIPREPNNSLSFDANPVRQDALSLAAFQFHLVQHYVTSRWPYP